MQDHYINKLAQLLVGYSTGIKKGELVRISGAPVTGPLLVALYRQVLAAGAHPFVQMVPEELKEIFLKNASDEQLAFCNPLEVIEGEKVDVSIHVGGSSNTRALTHCDPKKSEIAQSARSGIMNTFMQRSAKGSLRWVYVEYPTHAQAQDADMSLADYEDFSIRAGMLHKDNPADEWARLGERQQRLVDFLNGKRDYHVIASNGTDIRMDLSDKTWINCDGHLNFPDGEVFTGPTLDSVNGQLNFSFPSVYHGREALDVKLKFRDGKVVDAAASKGLDFLISMLDMDGGSRSLGECAIGTNFSISQYVRSLLYDEKIGGTCHFALGAGYPQSGNCNQSALHWDMIVDLRQGGYVEIDGQKVLIDGVFTNPQWPSAK